MRGLPARGAGHPEQKVSAGMKLGPPARSGRRHSRADGTKRLARTGARWGPGRQDPTARLSRQRMGANVLRALGQ